jgi:hypothetical protein
MSVSYGYEGDLVASEYSYLQNHIKLDQKGESLINYTHSFNYLYGYLKNDISLKTATI